MMSTPKKRGVKDAALSFENEIVEEKIPSRLLVIKNFALTAKMPGQASAVLTKYFREGQIIYEPSKIKFLLENNAPVEILN